MSSLFYLVNVAVWFYVALQIVIADDVLEYQLLSFENPHGLLANGRCCDVIPFLRCNSRYSACDNDFTVCIDPLNSGSGIVFCTKKVQFGTEEDTNSLRFGNTLGRTGNYENPIKVLYKRWKGGVKIKVRVKDRDAGIDDLVGRFTGFYRRTLAAPTKQAAAWESLTIGSGSIKLKGRLRVYCTTCATQLPTSPSTPPPTTPSKPSPTTLSVSKPSPVTPSSGNQPTSSAPSEITSSKKVKLRTQSIPSKPSPITPTKRSPLTTSEPSPASPTSNDQLTLYTHSKMTSSKNVKLRTQSTPSKSSLITPTKRSPLTTSEPSPASPTSDDQSTLYTHSGITSSKKGYPKWVWIVVWIVVGYEIYVTLVGFFGGMILWSTREGEKPNTLRYIIYVALAPIALPVVVIVCCLAEFPGCLDCEDCCCDCDDCGCDCGDCGGCDCGGCDCGGCDCGGCVIM